MSSVAIEYPQPWVQVSGVLNDAGEDPEYLHGLDKQSNEALNLEKNFGIAHIIDCPRRQCDGRAAHGFPEFFHLKRHGTISALFRDQGPLRRGGKLTSAGERR